MDLLERDAQLAAVGRCLAAAAGGDGSMLLVRGAPGTGKSALLDAAAELARDKGFLVLRGCGGELETGFAFGAARQLFERRLTGPDRDRLLVGAAGFAAPLVTGAPEIAGDSSFALLHGLFWLTANLAADDPLLLVVDDAHWADRQSLEWLHYLGRRLPGLPAMVVVAARTAEPDSNAGLVDRLADIPGVAALGVEELSAGATARLVRADRDASPELVQACWTATGGNPLFVKELLRELAGKPVAPNEIREVGPASIARLVMARLVRIGPAAVDLARAVAVLGGRAPLSVAAGLARSTGPDAAAVADDLVGAGVLATADPPAFTHPVLRAAIYADFPAARRARAHARAASSLRATGAPADEVAAHLTRSPPRASRGTVDVLLDAGRGAFGRGAPELAGQFLARALAEPPAPDQLPTVLHLLGLAELQQGDPAGIDHLRQALPLCGTPAETARLARDLALALFLALDTVAGLELLDAAVEQLRALDPDVALALDATMLLFARITPFIGAEAQKRVDRLRPQLPPDGAGQTPGQRLALATVAATDSHTCAITAGRGAELAIRALDGGALLAAESGDAGAPAVLGVVLLVCDRFAEARAVFEAIVADGRARASRPAYAMGLGYLAHAHYRTGRLLDAEAAARAALEVLEQPHLLMLPLQVSVLVDVLVDRGALDEASALIDAYRLGGAVATGYNYSFLLRSRGNLRLAQHRPGDALRDFRMAGQIQTDCYLINPAATDWRSGAALALARLGRVAEAVSLSEECVALASTFAAPRALGMALHARALVDPDPSVSADLLSRAAGVLARSPADLEHARVLTDLGATLRRTNHRTAARVPLRAALDLAHRCHATALVTRAADELRATGARPRRYARTGADALTHAERRAAQLAAAGHTNREIAQALFITIKTVEDHLSRTYLKLGITTRADLAAHLGE